ncbi:polysaccharide lyase 6 family protein, partial [Candidatus Izimaplasma bacterium]|nr:polysaccharide lyase 6 family protein [Candidatus Izimaplasma bacterium]
GQLAEAKDKLVLYPGNELDRDFIILPRIGEFASTITWDTSNSDVINLNGNVTRSDTEDQDVTMTATLTIEDQTITKEIIITVKSTVDEYHPDLITTFDLRILDTIEVENKIELLAAILNAEPGDAIILKDGRYSDVNVLLETSGTKEHPIFIFAENPGEVSIEGESTIRAEADYVIIANLLFQNGHPTQDKGAIIFEGSHSRLTNTKFNSFEHFAYDHKWVSLNGQYNEVDHNTLDGKSTGGALLTVWRDDDSPQFHHIHHNHFSNYTDTGGANGYETIRLGTSHQSQSDSYIIIEDNLFENISGEIEIISVKSGRVVLRRNTIINSKGMFTFRHGKNNLAEDNVFLTMGQQDAGGFRAYDGGHVIRNNYIEGIETSSNTRGGIVIHSGVNLPGTETTLNAQWTSFNMLIEGNTIVNGRQSILFGGKYTHPTHYPELVNNFIVSPSYPVIRHDKLPVGDLYEGNYFYGVEFSGGGSQTVTTIPDGINYSSTIPTLTRNSAGLYLHETYGAQNLTVLTPEDVGCNF